MQKVLEDWHGAYHTQRSGRLKNHPTVKIPQQRRRFPTPIESGSSHDSEPPEDRPERSTPYHLPHGYTEEELAEFIQEHQPEETP